MCLSCLQQAGAGLNFPYSIVGVKMEFECGVRGRVLVQVKEEINRMDHQGGHIFV
jgi:hypothetical protein